MRKSLRHRVKGRARILLVDVFTKVFGTMQWGRVQKLGAGLGYLFWWIKPEMRRLAVEHLGIAFGDLSLSERRTLARASFRHLGLSAGELLHLRSRPQEAASRFVRVEGFEEVEALRRRGQPILILTAHCGNWELISAANHSHGLGLVAMARELNDQGLHGFSVDFRAHLGSETIARGSVSSSRQLLRVLRSGGALAMLIDQDIKTEGVFVPFFGRLAYTPVAAAHIARRLGAAVVPTFAERLADGTHVVRFHPPLQLPDDPVAATALMTLAIEGQIRRLPEQWVWMHRRWKRRPPRE
jgi:KDO2-lipid IV(A) lauroyltransferase